RSECFARLRSERGDERRAGPRAAPPPVGARRAASLLGLPFVQPQQLAAERGELGWWLALLDAARVALVGRADRRDAFAPEAYPFLAGGFVVLPRRRHRDVLAEADLGGLVVAVAVRHQPVPDDEVAGLHVDPGDLVPGDVGPARVAVRWLALDPVVELAEHLGDALEAAHPRRRVLQREHALHAEGNVRVLRRVGIPVDEAVVVVLGVRRVGWRLEVHPVDGDPQLLGTVDLAEDLVDPRVLAVRPHRREVVHLDHPGRGDDAGLVP